MPTKCSIVACFVFFGLSCQTSSFDKGKEFFHNNAYVESIACFSDYINEDTSKWEAYYFRGVSYKNLDELDGAERDLLIVLSMAPDPPLGAYGHIGDIYYKQGYTDNAVLYFHSAAAKDEFYPFVNYNLGLCYFDLEFPEKAKYYLRKEIKYNPSYPFSYYVIGDLFYTQDEYDSALYYLDKGLRLSYNKDAFLIKESILREMQR